MLISTGFNEVLETLTWKSFCCRTQQIRTVQKAHKSAGHSHKSFKEASFKSMIYYSSGTDVLPCTHSSHVTHIAHSVASLVGLLWLGFASVQEPHDWRHSVPLSLVHTSEITTSTSTNVRHTHVPNDSARAYACLLCLCLCLSHQVNQALEMLDS